MNYPHNNNPRFFYKYGSGNWQFEGHELKVLDLTFIVQNMLTEDRLKTIKLKEIAWRHKHNFPYGVGENCKCCGGEAYKNCDPNVPGIIAYNCPNPYDNKYRMLDGRHRIMRLLFEGKTKSKFYVFDFNEIKHFMRDDKNWNKSTKITITVNK